VRTVAVCQPSIRHLYPENASVAVVAIDGRPMTFARLEVPDPVFGPQDPANTQRLLLRVQAFSCNYRDKGNLRQLLDWAHQSGRPDVFFVLGSEFAAEVMAVGAAISDLRVGDRVE
jgi:NADPH:quinone reductase-like Zn-dependent oxidoreductase